jgi:hypothetical protein
VLRLDESLAPPEECGIFVARIARFREAVLKYLSLAYEGSFLRFDRASGFYFHRVARADVAA